MIRQVRRGTGISAARRFVRCGGLVIVFAIAATACGKSPTAPSDGDGSGGGAGTVVTVTSVAVTGDLTLSEGRTSQLTAVATLSDSTQQDVSASATWSTSNPRVATVSGTGLVTAVAAGTADITAVYEGRTARATAQVSPVTFRLDVHVESVTALDTCDDFTQGLADGEFAVRVLAVLADGSQTTLASTTGYPGNPDDLRVFSLGRNESRTLDVDRSYTLPGKPGEFVRLQLNATEWDEQIVLIPPSTRLVPDVALNDRSTSRSHSFSNGTFSSLGPNTLTVGNSSCGLRLNYSVSALQQ